MTNQGPLSCGERGIRPSHDWKDAGPTLCPEAELYPPGLVKGCKGSALAETEKQG